MLPSYLGVNVAAAPTAPFVTDALLDELSRHMASSHARRLSRGSNGHRIGTTMRVVKPSSASNSPRSSLLQSRRRTLVTEGLSAPRSHLFDLSYLPTPATEDAGDVSDDQVRRTARPVSWHPSSHLAPQVQQSLPMTQYPFPSYTETEVFPAFNPFPPTPAAYSGYTSPASAFSPLSLPYSGFEAPQYWTGLSRPEQDHPLCVDGNYMAADPIQVLPTQGGQTASDSSSDWSPLASRAFARCASPPTPDNYPAPLPETKLSPEESIPYEPLEDEESEGEILYGMGLYDTPERPEIDSFTTPSSRLFDVSGDYPEPTGKGLKLEDAWEPPSPEEEDDDDDERDGDEDAQGEDQED